MDALPNSSCRFLVVNGNHDIMIPTINSYILAQHLPRTRN